jgi:peptide/nickel transport system ATP-binding protein
VSVDPLLTARDVAVSFDGGSGRRIEAVRGVDLDVARGEVVAVVGESGSGKSVTMLATLGLLGPGAIASGSIRFDGEELIGAHPGRLRRIRGRRIGTVFQDPLTSLNPAHTIGRQLAEAVLAHHPRDKDAARRKAAELLELVSITDVGRRLRSYPHELSGGMRQRVMIGMALANDPDLLIADEPTTALDVTIQAQILDVLANVQRERHLAVLLVTHDLGVVAGHTDQIYVMYAGKVVERAPTTTLFANMKMPYTEALMESIPALDAPSHSRLRTIPGRPPDLVNPPRGCRFAPRCAYARDRCLVEEPKLEHADTPEHQFACFFPVGSPEYHERKVEIS